MNYSNLGLAYQVNPATKPEGWRYQDATGTTYSSALATVADSETLPSTDMTTGRWLLTPQKPIVQLAFTVTDADNENIVFGVYGLRSLATGPNAPAYWATTLLMNGYVTAGTKSVMGGVGSDKWADTITVSSAALPSSSYRVCNTTNDMGWLEVDARDFQHILVILTTSGAPATAGTGGNLYEAYATL